MTPSATLPGLGIRGTRLISTFPVDLTFWRGTNATVAKRQNPLFSLDLSVTLQSFALDVMHCLNLGTYKAFAMTCIWWCLLADVWATGAGTQTELVAQGFLRFTADLGAWYAAERNRVGACHVHVVQKFTLRMLGTPAQRTLATKAAETGTLTAWCTWKLALLPLEKLGAQGSALLQVGRAFGAMADVMKRGQRVLQAGELQRFVDATITAFQHRAPAGIPWTPKWHLMLHVAARARLAGNPQFYHTFLDEDYNGRVAKMAAACHRLTWHKTLLANFRRTFSALDTRRVRARVA